METETTSPKRRDRRIQVRIAPSTLFIVVVTLAALLGWIDTGSRTQQATVRTILELKGRVRYDWQGTLTLKKKSSFWPASVVKAMGVDLFHDVVEVDLDGPGVTDEVLAKVGRLRRLDSLSFDASNVTDAGMAELSSLKNLTTLRIKKARNLSNAGIAAVAGLTRLKYLSIERTGWQDADLAHLSELKQLLELQLSFDASSQITDAGIAHLSRLRDLQTLSFNGSQITTKGVQSLQGMENLGTLKLAHARITSLEPLGSLLNLARLDLTGNPIDDRGLEVCAGWPRLQSLILARNPALTDAGMIPLGKMHRIRSLDLRGTNIGDPGLRHLADCPILDELDVSDTHIGDDGLAALANRRPAGNVNVKASNTQVTPNGMTATHFDGSHVTISPLR